MSHYRRHLNYFLAQKMKRAQEEQEEAELEEHRRRREDSSQDRPVFFKLRKRRPYWK